jgi:hypothetical protein
MLPPEYRGIYADRVAELVGDGYSIWDNEQDTGRYVEHSALG